MSLKEIFIKGAREHNLQNIDVRIPRDKFVVITGLSGSGKSSLAFDTIYAEGQRRYVESLSAYARQFLGLMEKPDLDYIEGLSPAISIEQKSTSKNPRSTVGTVTEIYDYLRLLFARIGTPYCPEHNKKIDRQTVDQMVHEIMSLKEGTKFQVLAPMVRGRKGEYKDLFEQIRKDGFVRVRVDGETKSLEDSITLKKNFKHSIDIVVDRLVLQSKIRKRLSESLETAMAYSAGLVRIDFMNSKELLFSEKFACPVEGCQTVYEEIAPRIFSFNSPYGACPNCDGLGSLTQMSEHLLVPDETLSIMEGALVTLPEPAEGWMATQIKVVAKKYEFSLHTPYKKLSRKEKNLILYGTGFENISFRWKSKYTKTTTTHVRPYEGIIPNFMRRYKESPSKWLAETVERLSVQKPCRSCKGKRLKPEALSVKIQGKSIADTCNHTIKQAFELFQNIKLNPTQKKIAKQILKEINERLSFLLNVGLDYLSLDRAAATLSGGESQRIRLATQIGSQLMGVLYILDEPSIGLHQRDNNRLISTLKNLKNLGNTVLVVEHDRETLEASDHIIDLGPGAGKNGGHIVVQGSPAFVGRNKKSITGAYLSGREKIEVPAKRREGNGQTLTLKGARGNNLKNITVNFPLGKFICVTGVSGSGKSTLINRTLSPLLRRKFYNSRELPDAYESIKGTEHLDKVIQIDQSPIGRTPRSNPATYTKLFDPMRDLFAKLPEAKMRGYQKGRFSFNVKGGRCENCQGDGLIKIEMHFLPDVYITCDICKGQRYNTETLEVRYKGKSIADVLNLTVEDALSFFEAIPQIRRKLQTLQDVGLGYIHLGQQATTLSGGEAQRVKLSTELSKISTGRTLYILDEPTTGLHLADIKLLLKVLHDFVEKKNTVIVIEHNLDVIKTADQVIDLGPEGGHKGGSLVAEGSPEELAKVKSSYTGFYLKKELKR